VACHEIHLEEDRHDVVLVHHILHVVVHPGGMIETFGGMGRQIMTGDTKTIEATTVGLKMIGLTIMTGMTEGVMITTTVVESHHIDIPKTIITGHLIEVKEEMTTIETMADRRGIGDMEETKSIEGTTGVRNTMGKLISLVVRFDETPDHRHHQGKAPFRMQVV